MNKFITILAILTLLSCNHSDGQKCTIPKSLKSEIEKASTNNDFKEEDFYRINAILFDYDFKDDVATLKKCDCYVQNIASFFNSDNSEKRVLAYRLIGVAEDPTFNDKLLDRIKSNESDLLKTWSSTALMANKTSEASDELFKLFSSFPNSLPIDILINMYVQYDTVSVKKTCWKYINSENRNQQILSIQCLAGLGEDKILQERLIEFLDSWDMESKGWVISSMSIQKMEELKPLLKKYTDNKELKGVIIRALENSPTKTDNEYAKELKE